MPTSLVATTTVPDVSVGHALVQMVVALAVIVGSIYVLSKFLTRLRNGQTRSAGARAGRKDATKGLTVLSRQPLGKDLSIAAVRWGDREVLVGIAGSTITFLNDARGEEPVAHFGTLPPAAASTGPNPVSDAASSLLAAAARQTGSRSLAGVGAGESGERPSLLASLRDATLRR